MSGTLRLAVHASQDPKHMLLGTDWLSLEQIFIVKTDWVAFETDWL